MYIIAIATNIEQKSLRNKTKEWALYRNHKGIGRNSQQSSNLNISKLIYQPPSPIYTWDYVLFLARSY